MCSTPVKWSKKEFDPDCCSVASVCWYQTLIKYLSLVESLSMGPCPYFGPTRKWACHVLRPFTKYHQKQQRSSSVSSVSKCASRRQHSAKVASTLTCYTDTSLCWVKYACRLYLINSHHCTADIRGGQWSVTPICHTCGHIKWKSINLHTEPNSCKDLCKQTHEKQAHTTSMVLDQKLAPDWFSASLKEGQRRNGQQTWQ